VLSNNQCALVNLRCISTTGVVGHRRRSAVVVAFWLVDCGRRCVPRKATASAAAPGPRARETFPGPLAAVAGKLSRPDLALHAPHAGPNLLCQKATKNGRHRPSPKGTQDDRHNDDNHRRRAAPHRPHLRSSATGRDAGTPRPDHPGATTTSVATLTWTRRSWTASKSTAS
jgi:hypothetical protein